jgi:tetratricopeptide (TPR) repeat protein
VRLGRLYQRVGRLDSAREAYELSAQLGGHPVSLVELARLELTEGHAAQARELLLPATKEKSLSAEAYLLLGDAERQMGRQAEAARRYEQASRLTSRETEVGREIHSRLVEIEGYAAAEGRADMGAGDEDETRRPGCVTVYALLLALPALAGLAAVALALVTGLKSPDDLGLASAVPIELAPLRDILPLTIALIAVTALLQLLIAVGLWSMKNWARVILIALQLVVFIGQAIATGYALLNMGAGAFEIPLSPAMISVLVSFLVLGLEAYIIVWFVTSRRRFS